MKGSKGKVIKNRRDKEKREQDRKDNKARDRVV